MKLLLYSFVVGCLVCSLSFAQATLTQSAVTNTTLQTGYAVITPLTGTGEGLSVTEIFGQQAGAIFSQASVVASPVVTLTDVVVNVNTAAGLNTGVAIVNPNNSPSGVTFTLRDQQGGAVATRSMTIGGHQQVSRFVTELFAAEPALNQPFTGLMFLSSGLPIGVLGLAFNGAGFTSLPVATQLTANTVITSTTPTVPTSTFTTTVPTPAFPTVPTVSLPGTPTFNGIPTPPTIFPTPTVTNPTASTFATTPTLPTFATTPTLPTFATTPTVPATTVPTTTTVTSVASPFVLPQIGVGIGGPGALLLPQVATGGGWVSQIMIANTSAFTQSVRVDFFNSSGAPMSLPFGSTAPSVVVAPGGVATITL
jgi:hypothetical protein